MNEDKLMSYFERSAVTVRQVFEQVEQNIIAPSVEVGRASFRKSPITTTFLTIFAFLSFLPVLSFLAFTIFLLSFTTFFALSLAFVVSTMIVVCTTSILSLLLCLLAIISVGISAVVVSAYSFSRLFVLVRADGRDGFYRWSNETKSRFGRGDFDEKKRGRSSSSGSLVVLKDESKRNHGTEENPADSSGVKREGDDL